MSNPKGNEASLTKFKAKWNKGTTQPIRVPTAIVNEVLEYARRIDEAPAQVNEAIDNEDEQDDYLDDETEPDLNQVIRDQAKKNFELLTENQVLRRKAQESKETLARVIEVLEIILLLPRFTKRHRAKVKNEVVEVLKPLAQVF
jgi:23S rRNA G2069 N7-methylase RlmK/C1962 C5-methylase RlmI